MSDQHDKKRDTMAKNLQAKTGRSVEAWVEMVRSTGLMDYNEIVSFLKNHHGLGHFQARMIASAHKAQRGG